MHLYRIFDNAGLYSEINNAVMAIWYCEQNNLDFRIHSHKANFSGDQGWHHLFEHHEKLYAGDIISNAFNARDVSTHQYGESILKNTITFGRNQCYKAAKAILSAKFRADITLTHAAIREGRKYCVKQFAHSEQRTLTSLRDTFTKHFKYAEAVREQVKSFEATLPAEFNSVFIRRGDKFKEARLETIEAYLAKLQSSTNNLPVFITSDDALVYKDIKDRFNCSDFIFDHTQPKGGFDYAKFMADTSRNRILSYQTLLARFEVVRRGKHIISTRSTNPGMWLGFMQPDQFIGIDADQWFVQ